MSQDPTHLIWIDLEMTGLEPAHESIIEIATVITDVHLNLVAEGPVIAIHQPDSLLATMDEWNTRQHNESGLVTRVRESTIDLATAEQMTLAFLQQYVPAGKSPICGNTVSQDRLFLHAYMPTLEKYFHYRQIDVSTLKELARRWMPQLPKFSKTAQHLAMSDIYESINELKYYREHFLRLPV
ncbi:oligoribonuclease [Beggiatoa leptomitoformis]|uniref:Oligoribonuclease n=1 Tax=Beggiatoa leptomitoformis TaxID=288004 RepID=A0A2N9YDW6_9GAMM|nr:oligoribonuclease [Beggiatoa leptomitoformis]ALG69031.1 oligoribonuclease [Beggiatoa leptomitoformis]AUI68565.1 oligoribonuclease [Beggiatoa leptomitoformis]